ncbi:unnamed protein product [Closterium sp. NIES-64]|nr:unnamed protein product [Closterium sp. NIES-64]
MTSATLAAPSAASARLAGLPPRDAGSPPRVPSPHPLLVSPDAPPPPLRATFSHRGPLTYVIESLSVDRQALRAATGRKPRATSVRPGHVFASADVAQLRGAREAIKDIITSKSCNPILIRLGWHDAGTFDKSVGEWPKQGGANGSIRFRPEIDHGANKGAGGGHCAATAGQGRLPCRQLGRPVPTRQRYSRGGEWEQAWGTCFLCGM